MKKRKIGMQNQAVAGVIEALLMVALVSIVISLIQLIYIPEVMEQREAEHMDLVSNQFSTLKSMIDLQGITKSSAPISSMLTLGGRDLPYFITVKAFGEVSVQEDPAFKITLNPPLVPPYESGIVPLTSIQYAADNSYFVDQKYILEGGGLILQQLEGLPVMRADPSISSVNNTNNITIHLDLPHFMAIPGKNITNGEGNCFIRTNYSSNRIYYDHIPMGGNISIYTAHLNAWNESLHNLLGIYAMNGNINIIMHPAQGYITIKPGNKEIMLQLNVIDIYVQIGQGWVL
ncbi:MAG TPA: hypothetical protein VMY59_10055 [Candidatus Thermoplasmatota archaeon]|nr:hypothetical protein [Candidatus Thermoplasmatota archaeon]